MYYILHVTIIVLTYLLNMDDTYSFYGKIIVFNGLDKVEKENDKKRQGFN